MPCGQLLVEKVRKLKLGSRPQKHPPGASRSASGEGQLQGDGEGGWGHSLVTGLWLAAARR